jgi:hypothetical protein
MAMKKLRLLVDAVSVESFATTAPPAAHSVGTVRAHAESGAPCDLTRSCPTNFCVTIPVTCDTFQPCTG